MSASSIPAVTFYRGEDPLKASKLNEAFAERLWRRGDKMLGSLILWRDPVVAMEAATKQYVDGTVNNAVVNSIVKDFNGRVGYIELLSSDVTDALGYTPYDAANPAGYITAAQVSGTAPVQSVAGRTGNIILTHVDITDWAATLSPYALASSVPGPSSTLPLMDSVAAVGTGTTYARADHVHSTDITRAPITSPTFLGIPSAVTAAPGTSTTQLATTAFVSTALVSNVAGVSSFNTRTGVVSLTYADVTSVLLPSSTLPLMDSTATIGTGVTWARADHIHPTDTSRYAASNPAGYQTAAQVSASLAGYLPLTGGGLTGALGISTANHDPLSLTSPNGFYCRIRTTVTGTRSWLTGTASDASYSIVDETAGVERFKIDTGGTVRLTQGLWASSDIVSYGGLYATYGSGLLLYAAGDFAYLRWSSNNWCLRYQYSTGHMWYLNSLGNAVYTFDGSGNFSAYTVTGAFLHSTGGITADAGLVGSTLTTTSWMMNNSGTFYVANNFAYYLARDPNNGNWNFVEASVVNFTVRSSGNIWVRTNIEVQGAGVIYANLGGNAYAVIWDSYGILQYINNGNYGYLIRSPPGAPFTMYSRIALYGDGTCSYAWYNGETALTWPINWSDRRLKKNIRPASIDALGIINRLPVHEADLTPPVDGAKTQHHDCSLITDEVEALIPRAVTRIIEGINGYDTLNEMPIVATLVRAVQQLTARVAQLEGAHA